MYWHNDDDDNNNNNNNNNKPNGVHITCEERNVATHRWIVDMNYYA